jgi:hypothetical protein
MTINARVAILVVASMSCAAPMEASGKAGTITYQNLVPGGIAIGGVTSRVDGPTSQPGSREAMALAFEEALRAARADIPLMGADRVRSAVGEEIHESMLAQFQLKGELAVATLDSIRAALGDSVRYLVVARVEMDDEAHDTTERDTDFDLRTDNSETFKVSVRTVNVGFRVYDLHDGKLAWKFRPVDSEVNEARVPESSTIFSPKTVLGQLEIASDENKAPYPSMPGVSRNLASIFDKFTRALPKRKK